MTTQTPRWTLESVYGLILLQRVTISEANYYAYHCRNCFSSVFQWHSFNRSVDISAATPFHCHMPLAVDVVVVADVGDGGVHSDKFTRDFLSFRMECWREFIYLRNTVAIAPTTIFKCASMGIWAWAWAWAHTHTLYRSTWSTRIESTAFVISHLMKWTKSYILDNICFRISLPLLLQPSCCLASSHFRHQYVFVCFE